MLKSAHVSKTVLTMTVSGCLYLLSTTSGFAGFEWIPQERPASPSPAAQPQQEIPMQVMEAPVAHVTGEPLQSPAAVPAQVMEVPAGQIIQQIPAPAQAAVQAAPPVIRQITAPEITESQIMTPSPFDAPAPVAVQSAVPAPAPVQVIQPAVSAPAPAVVAAPQRQAIVPAPIAEPQTLVPQAPSQPLHVPPPLAQAEQKPSVPAQVEALEQKQADVAREAENLMRSMTAPQNEPVAQAVPAAAISSADSESVPVTVPAPVQAETVIPVMTDVETPAKSAVDYTAQALAQTAESAGSPDFKAEKTAVAMPAAVVTAPVLQDVVDTDTTIPAQEPLPVNAPLAQSNLSIAEQAALKAEAAKKMLAERAAHQDSEIQPASAHSADALAPVAVPALSVVEKTDEAPAQLEVINEASVLEPLQADAPRDSLFEDLAATDSAPVAVNEMLERPEADPLVTAQENIVIPAVDATIANEADTSASLEAALAPQAPEARAVSLEEAQAVEKATTTEAPLAPVAAASADGYAVVYGFGEDMPLALALQQIVPEGYAYSFAKSVNPGTRVDWEGDRAWNVVLDEALGKAGLKAQIAGQAVTVVQASDGFTSSAPSVTKDHPEAKTFDVMWDLEPAAGTEVPAAPAPAAALSVPLEPVSLGAEGASQVTAKRTIKDPGETPSQQPSMAGAAAENQQQASLIPETNAVIENDMAQDLAVTELAAPAKDTSKTGVWSADKGQSLKKVLYGWSQKGNVQIIWEAAHDYIVADNVNVNGTLDEAMVTLFKVSMAEDNYPSVRIIESQKNSGKTAVVVVQDPSGDNKQALKSAEPAEATEG